MACVASTQEEADTVIFIKAAKTINCFFFKSED
jgi:hypothetical protein